MEDFGKNKVEDKKEMSHADVTWLIKDKGILNPYDAINIVLEYVDTKDFLDAVMDRFYDYIEEQVRYEEENKQF